MSHPYPSPSVGAILMLSPAATRPSGSHHSAKHDAAEVLCSDQSWLPVTVLAWHRLDKTFVQALTDYEIKWLVQLRLPDGTEDWFEFVSSNLRKRRGSSPAAMRVTEAASSPKLEN